MNGNYKELDNYVINYKSEPISDHNYKTIITHREYLNRMNDLELADFIINKLPSIYQSYTDSVTGLTKWFKEEMEDKK